MNTHLDNGIVQIDCFLPQQLYSQTTLPDGFDKKRKRLHIVLATHQYHLFLKKIEKQFIQIDPKIGDN